MADLFDIVVARKLSGGGGGGTSWTTLTEENVTTEQRGFGVVGNFAYSERITADTIKVTFNGTEYTCTKTVDADTNHYGAEWSDGYDFSTYPFAIDSNSDLGNAIFTETAGTYSIKIEVPAESGSSDFSTAMVTTNGGLELNIGVPYINSNKIETSNYFEDITFEAVLYNEELEIKVMDASNITTSGNISEFVFEFLEYKATITGDCTITIS